MTKIIQKYQVDGEAAAVQGGKRGMKAETAEARRLLTKAQEAQLRTWIVDKNPRQLKFDFALWTARAVRKLIMSKFKADISLVTVRRYLKAWGMTPQRPKKQAIQQNGKAVERWLNEEYPVIVKRAKQENATIFWEDETAVQQNTNWVRGYAPCG